MPIQQMLLGTGGGINYAVGQVVFDGDNASQSWTVPADVYSISVVCIGKGEGNDYTTSGDGGGLAWASNIPVTPGATLTYTTWAASTTRSNTSGNSVLSGPASGSQAAWSVTGPTSNAGTQSTTYFTGTPGASRGGYRGGVGGAKTTSFLGSQNIRGGGGAAGYSGQGGDSNPGTKDNTSAAGGAATAGWGAGTLFGQIGRGGGGGGVGLKGEGDTGDWDDYPSATVMWGGRKGSDGNHGTTASSTQQGHGGAYGGGSGGSLSSFGSGAIGNGGGGGIRIIWPGHERLYPSTRTADE